MKIVGNLRIFLGETPENVRNYYTEWLKNIVTGFFGSYCEKNIKLFKKKRDEIQGI